MNRATITSLASGLLFLLATDVIAESAPPRRGVTTCASSAGCGWTTGTAVPGRAVNTPPAEVMKDQIKTSAAQSTRPKNQGVYVPSSEQGAGNLPTYLITGQRIPSSDLGAAIIVPEKITGALLAGLRPGDVLPAEIEQSIKASPSVPTPIRAKVTAGRFRGAIILGTATLDRELKRVLLAFERMRLNGNDMAYTLRATGLALSGQVGLEGEHHTQEGTFFAAELGAAAAAGYADSTTSRTQSFLGGYQTEPTAANAAKQGAVQALSKTAERFAERARTAPEYTEIEGGRSIQIIVQEGPAEVSGT